MSRDINTQEEKKRKNKEFSLKVGIASWVVVEMSLILDFISLNREQIEENRAIFGMMALIIFLILLQFPKISKRFEKDYWRQVIEISSVIAIFVFGLENVIMSFSLQREVKLEATLIGILIISMLLSPIILFVILKKENKQEGKKYKMKSTIKWLHRNIYWIHIILIISTLLLQYVEDILPQKYNEIPTIWIGIALIIILEIIVAYEEHSKKKEEAEKEAVERRNERAKTILSNLTLLHDEKAEILRENTYLKTEEILENRLFYNVHSYMREICLNLRSTIARIIKEDTEYVDVSMIYKYREETEQWKWIAGKSGISGGMQLNDFVNKEGTLFQYIINNPEKSPFFCNKKVDIIDKQYKPGRRDRVFKNKGSVMAILLTYFNNKEPLIDAVLVISTYGVCFVKSEDEREIDKFKTILNYEILPYYIAMLQSEMGAMYLRHLYKDES